MYIPNIRIDAKKRVMPEEVAVDEEICKERVDRVFDLLNDEFVKAMPKESEQVLWFGCPLARFDHQKKERVFAHTNHLDGVVCCTQELGRLAYPYIFGVIAHEFGHVIAMKKWRDKSERGADSAVRTVLRLEIYYGTDLVIQYLSEKSLREFGFTKRYL